MRRALGQETSDQRLGFTDGDLLGHGRGRLPRLTSLRRAACAASIGVICVDNLETGSLVNIEHIRDSAFVHLNLDITDTYHVEEPVDFVYHLASPASPIDYLRLPLHTLKVGSYGTHHTLGLAKAKRARFLLASTSEIYGDPQEHPQRESYWGHVNPIGPRGVLRRGKALRRGADDGLPPPAGRPIPRSFGFSNTYGSRMRAHDGRVIPTLFAPGSREQARSPCLVTAPRRGRSVFVSDLIRGLIALGRVGAGNTPVNIGNPDEFTLLELVEVVLEVTGASSPIIHEALPIDDPKQRRPDITLARELLAGHRRSRSATVCG